MGRELARLLSDGELAWAAHLVPSWGLMQIAATLAAVVVLALRTRGASRDLLGCLAVAFPGAAAGGVALGLAVRIPALLRGEIEPRHLLASPVMAWGALAGLAVTFAAAARLRGHRLLPSLDALAPALGPVILLARVGCWLGGCDFGAVSRGPLAVRFPPGSPAFRHHVAQGWILPTDGASLSVHPTQLYEAGLGLLVLAAALLAERRWRRPGTAFAAAAAAYALGRFVVEFWRDDPPRFAVGPFSVSQWLSLLVVLALAGWAARGRSGPAIAATAPAASPGGVPEGPLDAPGEGPAASGPG